MDTAPEPELHINRFFIEAIVRWVEERGGVCERCFGDWLVQITLNGMTKQVVWYDIGLNSSTQYLTAKDKAATSWILQRAQVPTAQHFLLLRKDSQGWTKEQDIAQNDFVLAAGFPLVIKPNGGSNGTGVFLVRTDEELAATLSELFMSHRAIALSPFIKVTKEYRVTVLDGDVLLMYAKVQDTPGDFRFNLSHGAQVVAVTPEEEARVAPLAVRALAVLGARFANVDIVLDEAGNLCVLEINGGVAFEKYALLSGEHHIRAYEVYARALTALFGLSKSV